MIVISKSAYKILHHSGNRGRLPTAVTLASGNSLMPFAECLVLFRFCQTFSKKGILFPDAKVTAAG